MEAPIYETIKKLNIENNYPLCMPGHKRNKAFFAPYIEDFDFTEIGDNDNLHHPTGVIAQAQENFAKLMQCDECIMLVNGASSGILTAITAVVKEGDYVLVASNCHKSVTNALVISGAKPVYINPEIGENGISGGVSAKKVAKAFEKYPIKAVILVSPTYEGIVSDIQAIADVAHSHNAVLIIDEAHGAHFAFNSAFPMPAIRLGADISIESWHKTLPTFNQSALLCVNKERVDFEKIRQAFSLTTTTSPSYIILSQMDYTLKMLMENKEYFEDYVKTLLEIKLYLSSCKNLELVRFKGSCGVFAEDISKLVFVINADITGSEISDILKEKYGFQLELAAPHHIIAMTSVADYDEMLWSFADAIKEINDTLEYKKYSMEYKTEDIICPDITPREAFYAKKKLCKLSEAEGEIAVEAVIPYPPDIPLIAVGECISGEKISRIEEYLKNGTEVLGLYDGCVKVTEND
jgi:arginine/lysine/ornithine decarboxylase